MQLAAEESAFVPYQLFWYLKIECQFIHVPAVNYMYVTERTLR